MSPGGPPGGGRVVGPVPEGADPSDYDRLRRRVLWSLPSGLYVIGSGAEVEGVVRHNLMTANLVMQVATDPKLVAVAIDATAVTEHLVTAGGHFSVSVLGRQDRAVVRRFVKPVSDVVADADGRPSAMAGQPVRLVRGGVPVLEAAVAVLACGVRHRLPLGSHVLFVGEVLDVAGPAPAEGGGTEPDLDVLRMEDTRMSYGG
jgi:flavin reductase (DIM6/NTAB) family NADH-FMN oxidoreductase RutF